MRSIAYLTATGIDHHPVYDVLTAVPLRRRGFAVETVQWRAEQDWGRFAAVLPRSPWDYHRHPEEFFAVLERIDRSGARLFNDLATLRWNADKRYLGELADRGVPVVPTVFGEELDAATVTSLAAHFGTGDLVFKPVVGASADGAFRVRDDEAGAAVDGLRGRPWLAQPFMPAILDEGEYSLVYFDGRFSHALRKRARPGDFRVQESHGGSIEPVRAEARLLERGAQVLDALPADLLYARIDLVRDGDDFRLMEAELLEPSLYFGIDARSPERFARALADRLGTGA